MNNELRSKIDALWEIFWTGGITNSLDVIEQMTYLMFIRDLDDSDTQRAREAAMLGLPHKSIFAGTVKIGEREIDGGEPRGGVDRAARLGLAVLERADGEQEPVPRIRFRGGLRLGPQRGGDDRLRADDGGRIGRGRVRGGVFRPRRDERRKGEEGKQQGCRFHGCVVGGWWLVVGG